MRLAQILESLVWVCPPHILNTRLTSTIVKLKSVRPPGWKLYVGALSQPFEHPTLARPALDEAISACNRVVLAAQIGSGLQIKRLRAFRLWGGYMLVLFFAATPLLANPTALVGWPVEKLLGVRSYNTWFNALGVLIIGMMGGFLSGLLQSRSSRVTLADYQETMLKLVLRPMVGGIIALALVVLMSWHLIPAIEAKNAGAFLLAAFISGFSERYFLKLLDIQEDAGGFTKAVTPDREESTSTTSVVTPSPPEPQSR